MGEECFGQDKNAYGWFFGLIFGTALIVTIIYWAIFGFDRWNDELQRATTLMTAATVAPVGQAHFGGVGTGQWLCPQHGAAGIPGFDAVGVPHCPISGQRMIFRHAPAGNMMMFPYQPGAAAQR